MDVFLESCLENYCIGSHEVFPLKFPYICFRFRSLTYMDFIGLGLLIREPVQLFQVQARV